MSTVKLLSTPDHADGSHRIESPGGYEFWHFYAEDSSSRFRIAAGFHDGFGLHPDYIRRYAAYRRKPTRNAPPTPSQYPCFKMSAVENESRLASSTIFFPAGEFWADGESLSLGSNRVSFSKDEIILTLAAREQAISIELCLQPALPVNVAERSFPGWNHHWILARPLCTVSGQITHRDRNIRFEGLGQHIHYYGTSPMLFAAKRWLRGCVMLPRSAEMFEAVDDKAIAASADESGVRAENNSLFDAEWKKPLFGGQPYPSKMKVGERLILRNPRIAISLPGQLQIIYDAYVDGEQATAWVEVDGK
jgi:hypothetical protein